MRLSWTLPPQIHGAPRPLQSLLEKRVSPSQAPVTTAPSVPQPKKSLLRSPLSRQLVAQEIELQLDPVTVPERSAQTPQPVPETAAAKNDKAG